MPELAETAERTRPRLALWLKRRWWLLRWLPCGVRLWTWADNRVDRWHKDLQMALKYPIGQYNRRVQVRRKVERAPNEYREVPLETEVVAGRWARIEPLAGREFWSAQQSGAATSHRISFRYLAGLTSRDELVMGDRVFAVEAVLDLNDTHEEQECLCVERRPRPVTEDAT